MRDAGDHAEVDCDRIKAGGSGLKSLKSIFWNVASGTSSRAAVIMACEMSMPRTSWPAAASEEQTGLPVPHPMSRHFAGFLVASWCSSHWIGLELSAKSSKGCLVCGADLVEDS